MQLLQIQTTSAPVVVYPTLDGAKKNCPQTKGTDILYEGVAAGSGYSEAGTSDFLCLHLQPQFLKTTARVQTHRTKLYALGYQLGESPPALDNLVKHDIPCSLCYTPLRSTVITIPGRIECPSNWTLEYYGYLMSNMQSKYYKSRMSICIDAKAEPSHATAMTYDHGGLYFVETICEGIPCPP